MTAAGNQGQVAWQPGGGSETQKVLPQLFREAAELAAVAVGCASFRESLTLSIALESIRGEVCSAAAACAVPPAELEEILAAALREVPEGLEGHALEEWLLAEVRPALAAWRDSKSGLVVGAQRLKRKKRRK